MTHASVPLVFSGLVFDGKGSVTSLLNLLDTILCCILTFGGMADGCNEAKYAWGDGLAACGLMCVGGFRVRRKAFSAFGIDCNET
jgi:hypothetical protein